MTDILERLRLALLMESAAISPVTTEAIEAMRAAQSEIKDLRDRLQSAYMDGHDIAKEEYRTQIQDLEEENRQLHRMFRSAMELQLDTENLLKEIQQENRKLLAMTKIQ